MAKIYRPDQIHYIPVNHSNSDSSSQKAKPNHLGTFKFDAYTLALKCRDRTNRIEAHFKRDGRAVPVHFFDPFKGRLTIQQLKNYFNLRPKVQFKVEKHGRNYSVSMEHCFKLDGAGIRGKFWQNIGHSCEEEKAVHTRKRAHSIVAVSSTSSIEDLGCTRRIAAALGSAQKTDDNYKELEQYCYAVLAKYSKPEVQVLPGVHHEFSGLAFSKHSKIIEQNLEALLGQLKNKTLLDDDIIDALYNTFCFADPKFIKQNHLVEALKAISSKCKDFHDQAKTVSDLRKLLKTIAKTLDKMADCKVEALKFETDFQSLRDPLEKLKVHHTDWSISSLAAYALQSLVCITTTRTETDKHLTTLRQVLSGLDCMVGAAMEFKPGKILTAIDNFKAAAKKEPAPKKWHDFARYLCTLVEKKEWGVLKVHLSECLHDLPEKEMVLLHSFILDHVLEIATDHADDTIRVGAISILEDYLKEEATWGVKMFTTLKDKYKDKISKLKFALLSELHELAKLHNLAVSGAAEKALLQITILAIAKAHPKNSEGKADEENLTLLIQLGILRPVEGDMTALYQVKDSDLKYGLKIIKNTTPDEQVPEMCKVLFTLVSDDRSNLDSFIKNVATQATDLTAKENEDLKYLIETHVSAHCFDETAKRLDFEERVNKFLRGEIKDADGREKSVLLIKGKATWGKTTAARYLEYQLWEKCIRDPKSAIPVFISAAKLHDKTKKAVEEALIQKGFTKSQVKKIIQEKRPLVVIFDAYDEMGIAQRTQINLHQSNTLWKFNAKTIITCRVEFLSTPDVYNATFAPIVDSRKETTLLDEITILPFKKGDILAYITQFCEKYSKAPGKTPQYAGWDKVRYLQYIKPSLIDVEIVDPNQDRNLLRISTSPKGNGPGSPTWKALISPKNHPVSPRGFESFKVEESGGKKETVAIPGLYDLLSSPYLLFVTAMVLPKIVKENPNITTNLILRNTLIKEFVDFWITREEVRLLEVGVQVDSRVGIYKTCYNFLLNLVAKWHHSNLAVIEHDPECESDWTEEFSEANEPWRAACPLEPLGDSTWGMNPVLKEYLVFRQIVDVITSPKKKLGFGDKNFTASEITDPSIIQFFVDELKINAVKKAEKPKNLEKSTKKKDEPKDLSEVLKAFFSKSEPSSFAYINSKKILDAFDKADKSEAKEPESPESDGSGPVRCTSPA